ncbi:hypothetical protein THMIRHAT_12040 [Thiosulfativibrio zosterae]|uniref:Uncharacterized protein n=1 Tax=Thiosulfativibrio zosterae TaxID=2675053 RepID=A0A6F8PN29_9GAMM|nr:hypothetical protein THMIRHAT_12040 [Thiosulfativibrio zosterae]
MYPIRKKVEQEAAFKLPVKTYQALGYACSRMSFKGLGGRSFSPFNQSKPWGFKKK